MPHGGNCGASYTPGDPRLDDYSGTIPEAPGYEQSYVAALGKGFAVLSTALNNTGHNCNLPIQAESMMMAKERLVEQYGPIRYTIGTGCSGGSIAQHTIANAYPGIYQGLVTSCSYPDTLTAGAQFADYHLLRRYFEDPSRWGAGRGVDRAADGRGRGPPHAHERGRRRRGPVLGGDQPRERLPRHRRDRSPATSRRGSTPRPTPAGCAAPSST